MDQGIVRLGHVGGGVRFSVYCTGDMQWCEGNLTDIINLRNVFVQSNRSRAPICSWAILIRNDGRTLLQQKTTSHRKNYSFSGDSRYFNSRLVHLSATPVGRTRKRFSPILSHPHSAGIQISPNTLPLIHIPLRPRCFFQQAPFNERTLMRADQVCLAGALEIVAINMCCTQEARIQDFTYFIQLKSP